MKRVTTIDSKNININIKSGRGKKKKGTLMMIQGWILTQLLVRCIGEAFARSYIQHPFVATE